MFTFFPPNLGLLGGQWDPGLGYFFV